MTRPGGKRFPLELADVMQARKRTPEPVRRAPPRPLVASAAPIAVGAEGRPAAPRAAGNGLANRMVERLRAGGCRDESVLEAMRAVPRHGFVDSALAAQAYEDAALPIGQHQTISKPSVVARMIELVLAGGHPERVLEVGTGCGYQAAVLSHLADEVYSIERLKWMHERAKVNLRPLRRTNIRLHYGDGALGLPVAGPFQAILLAAAGASVPEALLGQLALGGRLVAPVGGKQQHLILIERTSASQWRETVLDPVHFVPLKSGVS